MLREEIGYAAMLEQTAEECSELAQACLKLARFMRGENPTPKPPEEIFENIYEEVADVQICIDELDVDLGRVAHWKDFKVQRMKQRIKEWRKDRERRSS